MKVFGSLCVALVAGFVCLACAGVPKTIPESLSASELIQKAQEASDLNRYKAATVYYTALAERYGSDPAYLCVAEYEIAFIDYKKRRYAEAKTGLTILLERYNSPGAEALPQSFKILAEKILVKINDIEAAKNKKAKPKKPAGT